MKRYIRLLSVFLLTFFLSAAFVNAQVSLRIGDAAPQLKYAKWFKGAPITGLKKGKIYVIEFWATWCAPCKTSIPHLTRVAHKFKDKVTIIGIAGSERPGEGETAAALVENFLRAMGDKMDYNVALDTEDKYMTVNWANAAAQFGIPCAFIVDSSAKIAWIGHSMEVESPLEQIVEGKFDTKAYAEKFSSIQDRAYKDAARKKKFNEAAKSIIDAYKEKDFAKVVKECEALALKDPSLREEIDPYYFRGLLQTDRNKLYTIARAEKTKKSERLTTIISLLNQRGLDKKFYDLVIEVCTPKIENDPNDYPSLSILEAVYEIQGNNEKALEMIDKMMAFAKKQNAGSNYFKAWNEKIKKLKGKK